MRDLSQYVASPVFVPGWDERVGPPCMPTDGLGLILGTVGVGFGEEFWGTKGHGHIPLLGGTLEGTEGTVSLFGPKDVLEMLKLSCEIA